MLLMLVIFFSYSRVTVNIVDGCYNESRVSMRHSHVCRGKINLAHIARDILDE